MSVVVEGTDDDDDGMALVSVYTRAHCVGVVEVRTASSGREPPPSSSSSSSSNIGKHTCRHIVIICKHIVFLRIRSSFMQYCDA